MRYFVTGATGFIGRHLVERLLEREGTIHVLVREGSRARLEELMSRWGAEPGRIVPVIGDLTAPELGVSDADRKELTGVDHFFHLAAIYDMSADEESNRRANVEGTRNAVALANSLGAGPLPPHQLDRGVGPLPRRCSARTCSTRARSWSDPYPRTKFESEKIVREELTVPWRVYRPGHRGRQLADRRDGQDRRPVLLLQGDPAGARPACRRGCRPSASREARSTSCPSISSPRRWTTSPTRTGSTARRSTSPTRTRRPPAR